MTDRRLPDWIDAYLEYTENSEPDPLFRKWAAISTIAAVLQRKCYVCWGPSLIFYPNLFVVLVGPSGSRKGTAMNPCLDLITDLGNISLAANATSLQALIRRLTETNYTDFDPSTGEHQYHASLTIFSKEFTVFLGYQNNELMAALCDWYDCDRRWKYETISRQTEEIIGVWVNLFGGTTPELIAESLPQGAIGGGLTSRIIFVYAKDKGKTVPIPLSSPREAELRTHLLHDLEKIHLLSGQFSVTEDFLSKWTEWYTGLDTKPPPFEDVKMRGYVNRRPTHIMKLCIILAASRRAEPKMCITSDDFDRALEILTEAETRMMHVFTGFGKSSVSEIMPRVLAFMALYKGKDVPVSHVARQFYNDLDNFQLERLIKTMEIMGIAKVINRPGSEAMLKYIGSPEELNAAAANFV